VKRSHTKTSASKRRALQRESTDEEEEEGELSAGEHNNDVDEEEEAEEASSSDEELQRKHTAQAKAFGLGKRKNGTTKRSSFSNLNGKRKLSRSSGQMASRVLVGTSLPSATVGFLVFLHESLSCVLSRSCALGSTPPSLSFGTLAVSLKSLFVCLFLGSLSLSLEPRPLGRGILSVGVEVDHVVILLVQWMR
jgi:hypothetical protein